MARCTDHAKLQLEGVKIERRKELGRGSYGFVIEVSVNETGCMENPERRNNPDQPLAFF